MFPRTRVTIACRRNNCQVSQNSSRLFLRGMMPPVEEQFQQHESGAQHNRRIGQIEGGPMPSAEMKVEKIDDRTAPETIDHIAHGTTDH